MAHPSFLHIVQHLQKPFMAPVGAMKRRGKLGSSVLSDFLALRKCLFLCRTCEGKMPYAWARRWEYRLLPNMHADACRCDGCQQVESVNVYHPEDGGYVQEYQALQCITDQAAAQQLAVRDKRRIPGRV